MKIISKSITTEKKLCSHVGCLILFLLVLIGPFLIFATGTAVGDQDGDYTYTTSGSPAVATITGYTGAGGAITIPSTLGGYATVAIGDEAFYNCTSLTLVTIPSGVTSIGASAFVWCTSLTSVTIPNSVTSIGNYAFQHCGALTSVTIPNGVTSIGRGAFQYSALTSVTISSSVASIGKDAFDFCTSLIAISVDAGNANYASIDGVLYNKAVTTLIQCPGGKAGAFTIPSSVTSIGDFAFSDCPSLTSVTIPNSVTSIGDFAFSGCTSLTFVTIPNSVTSVGERAFLNCTSLTSIEFLGLVAPTTVGADWIWVRTRE
jgi:hypothetical protein